MSDEIKAVERGGPGPLETIGDNEWQALLSKDDRNSPEEYPEMALITRAELGGAMCEAYILAKDQAGAELTRLQAEVRELLGIERLARELISPAGMVNRGVDRGLVVIEKADKSDPHYRLCSALDELAGSRLAATLTPGEQP